jgi:transcriptional regulator with XRE-family HTH domain
MITRTNFGEHLRKARGARGLRDVAAEIKVSHGTLSRVERGLIREDLRVDESGPVRSAWLQEK